MLTRSLDRILDPARRQHASNEGGRGAAPRGEEEEEEANNLFAVADANANADNWMEGFVADPGMGESTLPSRTSFSYIQRVCVGVC